MGTSNRFAALNASQSFATGANLINLQLNDICKRVVGVPRGPPSGQRNIGELASSSIMIANPVWRRTQRNPRVPLKRQENPLT